ncbi:ATP-binding cassette domain-containing protein, partial [Providencia rettgeri]
PAGGRILIGDTEVTGLPPYKRGLAMVVQNYALFPHMKVEDNVAFGLRAQKQPKALIADRVQEALKIVGMADYATRYPHQLSGGQQQRVAIARALMMEPQVLLFDEPTAALDPEITAQIVSIIRELAGTGITQVIVTHEVEVARKTASRVVYMENGHIIEQGDASCFTHPQTDAFKNYL